MHNLAKNMQLNYSFDKFTLSGRCYFMSFVLFASQAQVARHDRLQYTTIITAPYVWGWSNFDRRLSFCLQGGGVHPSGLPMDASPSGSMYQKTDGQQAGGTHPTGIHSCFDMAQRNDSDNYNVINVVVYREFNKYVSCNDSIMFQWLKTNQA